MTNPNDPIVPNVLVGLNGWQYETPPLTKRELFAAMAMQGLLSCRKNDVTSATIRELTRTSVIIANELIYELNKNEK